MELEISDVKILMAFILVLMIILHNEASLISVLAMMRCICLSWKIKCVFGFSFDNHRFTLKQK